jgi:hypothetical protein
MSDPVTDRREVIQRELIWHEQQSHRRYHLDALLYDSPAFDEVVQQSVEFLQGGPGNWCLIWAVAKAKRRYIWQCVVFL